MGYFSVAAQEVDAVARYGNSEVDVIDGSQSGRADGWKTAMGGGGTKR